MSVSNPITSADDRIDLRNVIDRMDWLACDRTDDENDVDPLTGSWGDPDQRAEWLTLHELMEEVTSTISDDPHDGIVLISECEWVDYAKDWYADTYVAPWIHTDRYGHPRFDAATRYARVSWDDIMATEPFMFIDWQAVADNLRRDRAEFEWEGVTFILG